MRPTQIKNNWYSNRVVSTLLRFRDAWSQFGVRVYDKRNSIPYSVAKKVIYAKDLRYGYYRPEFESPQKLIDAVERGRIVCYVFSRTGEGGQHLLAHAAIIDGEVGAVFAPPRVPYSGLSKVLLKQILQTTQELAVKAVTNIAHRNQEGDEKRAPKIVHALIGLKFHFCGALFHDENVRKSLVKWEHPLLDINKGTLGYYKHYTLDQSTQTIYIPEWLAEIASSVVESFSIQRNFNPPPPPTSEASQTGLGTTEDGTKQEVELTNLGAITRIEELITQGYHPVAYEPNSSGDKLIMQNSLDIATVVAELRRIRSWDIDCQNKTLDAFINYFENLTTGITSTLQLT